MPDVIMPPRAAVHTFWISALLAAALLSGCSPLPCAEQRHASGLLLVCPDPYSLEQYGAMPEALKGAASFAWDLAEDHPDDFGFPWADPETHVLELRITGPRGHALASDWMSGRIGRGQKFTELSPRPEVRVALVDRSFRQLSEIQHGVTFLKDLPGYEVMYETGPDRRRNATVITIEQLSDPLLQALAAKYGTAAVVIRVDPASPRFSH